MMPQETDHDYDFTPLLMSLTVDQLLMATNFAMNRLSIRDIGELGHHLGGRFTFKLEPKNKK